MTIKSFFADTVAAAIREARAQFGEEAMLLKSRRAPEEARHLGAYEVVFGVLQAVPETPAPAPVSEGIWDAVFETAPQLPALPAVKRADTEALYRRMLELEFDPRLAADFSERIKARLLSHGLSDAASHKGAAAKDSLEEAIALEAERFFEREDGLLDGESGGVAALIGPAGSGKTSTVVRLAVAYGLARNRRVLLLAADDHRVAASAKLPHYASLLGVECHAACRPREIEEWLKRRGGDLILIDTPGYGPHDAGQAQPLAGFLAQHTEIQKHLVLPATLKTDDLRAAIDRFESFAAGRLVFTRLDETDHCGPAFSEAAASGKPISFLSMGQQVPGDIVPARRFEMAALLRTQQGAMASAA